MKQIEESRMWLFYKTVTLVCSVAENKERGGCSHLETSEIHSPNAACCIWLDVGLNKPVIQVIFWGGREWGSLNIVLVLGGIKLLWNLLGMKNAIVIRQKWAVTFQRCILRYIRLRYNVCYLLKNTLAEED